MTSVCIEDIEQLLVSFATEGQYDARTGEENMEIQRKCKELFEKDYSCCIIENEKGLLSVNYPSEIIIPFEKKVLSKESEISESSDSYISTFSAANFKEIANKSNSARCRKRFPVPVIFCEGKFVCRSATLACGGEMLFRDVSGCIFNAYTNSDIEEKNSSLYTSNGALSTDRRSQDIKLLKELSVSYICDLMVENKKVKFGLRVTSSEKVDKENRYCDFKIMQLPYPGCEFFKKFKDNNYVAQGLMFDWEQSYVDSPLRLPSDSVASSLGIQWCNYKMWDLVKLTQNYLKLLLTFIVEDTSSILIHCISGWDRTPLFISLLRISLWADGRAHASLSAVEIAYLTLAYDWYLFGHDLPSRLKSGEEILLFCFEFLLYLASDEFSTKKRCRKISNNCADNTLDILVEEECPGKSTENSESCSSVHKYENGRSSTFYASLDPSQDNPSPTLFCSSLDSEESDSLKIWQFVSGTGSLLGSVTSRISSEVTSNGSHSNCSLSSESSNGNIASAVCSNTQRAERLKSVRTLVIPAYRKAIESKDGLNSDRYSYFSWRL
ncbi:myotubularin-related protein 14-like isoform X2 [Uloborus diversus]|uniref:myotubularin-related protein 14-like isoform X2 n=1 Tax=Uloborus diversus TaxID=327109 RepID=UPI00240927FB|nr:myotubularin-related protein 14-like isoform X2 [Uloborus diversus]